MAGEKRASELKIRLTDSIHIDGSIYKDGSNYRCKIKLHDIISKETYVKIYRRGNSISELENYFAASSQKEVLSKVPGLFDSDKIIPGITLSFFHQLHENSIGRRQVKGFSEKKLITLREEIFKKLENPTFSKLDRKKLEAAFNWYAKSNLRRTLSHAEKENEFNRWFNACISVFNPILQHAVLLGILEENYTESIKRLHYRNANLAITKRLSRICLSSGEEDELCRLIHKNWRSDDRYLAMAFSFQLAIRPSELCALTYGDVIQNESFPEMYSLLIQAQSNGRKSTKGRVVTNLDSEVEYRKVPIPKPLMRIIEEKRGDRKDADYIFTGIDGNFDTKLLQGFFLEQLREVVVEKDSLILATNREEVQEYCFKLTTTLFLSNARHRMRTICGMTESEINYISGLSQGVDTDGAHYRDWNSDLTQYSLYLYLERRRYHYSASDAMQKTAMVKTLSFEIKENKRCELLVNTEFGCSISYKFQKRRVSESESD